ncbi:hypothetical protein BU25DRAFT_446801 [Macroventuria anomochaeta]|uniref:Uncharacterized protein n=1 Tax=Macroventuria anomochaeta TaxID=301207 RepID=A0ACB6S7L2_9PLEO|nr:uncharacterized protein BU25DRAFT_446801 [Macroventuria anomochaeta]KAF2629953.1 hypothetical protein BU25DRAFT_446801 [Macroventuria anomochaeta]
MSAKVSTSRFLDLPTSIREKIYAYLLLPHPEEDVTTINYTLNWLYLDKPSNTTFAGSTQIDLCSCPREDIHYDDSPHDSHIYTRYKCIGPDIHFTSPRNGLWVLQTAHGQFNILRPASADELKLRPTSAILQVSKQIYSEALPFLYRDRDFFFLTGPCPRGRYQAYATLQWLGRLSERARANVEILTLLVQTYEEDCNVADVEGAYVELAEYIVDSLPGFKWLCIDVWDEKVYGAASVFSTLFEEERMGVVARKRWQGFEAEVFVSKESFLGSFEEEEE